MLICDISVDWFAASVLKCFMFGLWKEMFSTQQSTSTPQRNRIAIGFTEFEKGSLEAISDGEINSFLVKLNWVTGNDRMGSDHGARRCLD